MAKNAALEDLKIICENGKLNYENGLFQAKSRVVVGFQWKFQNKPTQMLFSSILYV